MARSTFYDLLMTHTNMSMQYPQVCQQIQEVCQDIQEILGSYSYGLPVSCLDQLPEIYKEKFHKPLDFGSLGVDRIDDLLRMMHDKIMFVTSGDDEYLFLALMVDWRQQVVLLPLVQELLDKHCGEILFSYFEGLYENKYKVELDYHWYGLTDLGHLCDVFKDILVVEVNSSGEEVMKAVNKYTRVVGVANSSGFPEVCQQIQEILGSYYYGIPFSCLSWLEEVYQQKFKRSLDCKSFGVNSIEDLLYKMMPDKVMVYVDPRSKEKYAQSVLVLEERQKGYLKYCIQGLLDKNCGESLFSSFDDLYERKYKLKLNYGWFGLTNLDHLCDVLKDILVVEVNSSGEKVIKAVKKDTQDTLVVGVANSSGYNLRKRKY